MIDDKPIPFDRQPGMESPQLVWAYTRGHRVVRIVACQPEFVGDDYHTLIHPSDASLVLAAIKGHIRRRKHHHRRAGQLVSRHRIRNAQGRYCTHLSAITLSWDTSNRLAFVVGFDYQEVTTPPPSERELHSDDTSDEMRLRRRSDRRFDPFVLTWLCAGYVISPSLFRMVRSDSGAVIELTKKQARFVALLLGSRDSEGVPVYVRREMTRRQVFGADTQSRIYDNDIDRLVKFFRQFFGRAAIGTKRCHGHILRAESRQCSDYDAKQLAARAH